MSFNPIVPNKLILLPPEEPIKNEDFSDLLMKARVEMAELKGACGQIPNPLLLTSPAVIRESVASSNIENINTTLVDVLQGQLFPETEQRTSDKEVLRYREALLWGFESIKKYALSTRVILGVQNILLPEGGSDYRRKQNVIVNSATKEVLYTPPVASDISGLMDDWEKYVNGQNQKLDPLIRTIIAHYQFESIHPFEDGNGRTGRIMMVLQLIKEELLSLPVLYISGYINRNRPEYYRLLREVTSKNEWHGFIAYMLEGFYLQARETKDDLKKITDLFVEIKHAVKRDHKKIYSADLVEALFTYPVISPVKLATVLDKHYTTTSKYLAELAKAGILKEAKIGKYHFYGNEKLIKILSK
jgi:Fic family protein